LIFDDSLIEKPYTDENEIVVGFMITAKTATKKALIF